MPCSPIHENSRGRLDLSGKTTRGAAETPRPRACHLGDRPLRKFAADEQGARTAAHGLRAHEGHRPSTYRLPLGAVLDPED